MKQGVAILLLAVALTVSAVAAQKYVGYRHKGVVVGKTLPNGVKDLGGALLEDENFGMTHYSKGRRQYMWLEKIVRRDSNGVPEWIVRDVISFGRLPADRRVVFSYGSVCDVRGVERSNIVLLERVDKVSGKRETLKAWFADTKKGRFRPVSVKGIACRSLNENE